MEREAAAYDEAAVQAAKKASTAPAPAGGCPGMRSRMLHRETPPSTGPAPAADRPSELRQWPVQLKLVPVRAPYYDQADLLVAADCSAYAFGDFHERFLRGRTAVIGCPKLDAVNYAEKLTEILKNNDIHSVTVVRMEVPCCGGIVQAVMTALQNSGKWIPWQVVTLSVDGQILGNPV